MLRHTTIVPETDARAAAKMITEAIGSLDVVLMILLGKGEVVPGTKMDDVVNIADQLCNKTQFGAVNLRHVVWVRDLSPQSIRDALKDYVDLDNPPVGVVLNFHDKKMGTVTKDKLEPYDMEVTFAKGHGQ